MNELSSLVAQYVFEWHEFDPDVDYFGPFPGFYLYSDDGTLAVYKNGDGDISDYINFCEGWDGVGKIVMEMREKGHRYFRLEYMEVPDLGWKERWVASFDFLNITIGVGETPGIAVSRAALLTVGAPYEYDFCDS